MRSSYEKRRNRPIDRIRKIIVIVFNNMIKKNTLV